MAGEDAPQHLCSDADRDGDLDGARADPRVVAEAWAVWRDEAASPTGSWPTRPTSTSPGPRGGGGGLAAEGPGAMVEAYAGHNAHADLLRQGIDGAVGQ